MKGSLFKIKAIIHEVQFNGDFLKRGFWLYIWDIVTPERTHLYYVGRTGDSSSINAQSPFNRMAQHLGDNNKNNVLRRHLRNKDVTAEGYSFRLVAYGPILEEATTQYEHVKSRDTIAALEKILANSMKRSGYNVLNTVNCKKTPDLNLWIKVREAFAEHFPGLDAVP